MKIVPIFLSVTAMAITSIATVNAEQPTNVGSAERSEGPCFVQTIVGPPGDFVPILDGVHGVLLTNLGEGKFVDAKSAKGTAKLTCHGTNKQGVEIAGYNVVTGILTTGTPAGTKDACDALDTFGLIEACRGNNNGAVILDAEFDAGTCGWGERETLDWTSVRAPSGKSMLSCHFKD